MQKFNISYQYDSVDGFGQILQPCFYFSHCYIIYMYI